MYIKVGINYKIRNNLMDDEMAAIWVEVSMDGGRKLLWGCVYREHRNLKQGADDTSASFDAQISRWNRICETWKCAGNERDCLVMGDLNLDFSKWNNSNGIYKALIAINICSTCS